MTSLSRSTTFAAVCVVVTALASEAGAESTATPLREAEHAYFEGRYEEALELLEASIAAGDLATRQDLRGALLLRLQVAAATRDDDAVERDLVLLAELDPEEPLPETIPPWIRERFSAVRRNVTPLELEVNHEVIAGGVVVHASASASRAIVAVHVYARLSEGEWVTSVGDTMRVPMPPGTPLEYYAEALGPGGVIVARAASREEPQNARMPGAPPSLVPSLSQGHTGESPGGTGPPRARRWGIGLSVLVVVAGVVGLSVWLSRREGDPGIELEVPTIRW